MSIETTKLKNGLTIATDNISNFETASVGIFVNIGSVNETAEQSGLSHFLEHMAFKGTTKRSALQISHEIESVGGYMNAYTSKEVTAFHSRVLKGDIKLAVDIIMDIVQNSTFEEKEFEKEKGVIIQEIRMQNDTPDDYVFDMFQSKCFDGESLGTQILGSEEDILKFSPEDMKKYLTSKYSTDKMIMCASGNVDHSHFIDLANQFSDKMSSFKTDEVQKQSYKGGFIFKKKELEQTHLVLGFEGLNHTDENKYDMFVLSMVLGGGMSSRLFQEVREKRSLVYSIFSFTSNYRDSGTFGVYAACEHNKSQEVIDIVKNEFAKINLDLTESELEKAKTQIRASLLMGLESSSARMERMANQFLLQNKFISSDEVSKKIDSITKESVINVGEKIFKTKPTLAVIGNGNDIEKLYEVFK